MYSFTPVTSRNCPNGSFTIFFIPSHPPEYGFRILITIGTTSTVRGFGMRADAAQKNGCAVEQNLATSHLNCPEPNFVFDGILPGPNLHTIELRMFGRPQLQISRIMKMKPCASVGLQVCGLT